jgi:hypothetical protein
MSRNLTYEEWLPFTQYEKNECDIKLKSGTIVKHVYPNAGYFTECCGPERFRVSQDDVAEIMYRKYYINDLCNGDCNKKTI